MKIRRVSAAILILAAMLLGACAEPTRLFDSDSKSLTEPDSTLLRIAAAPENEPFVYTDTSGALLGFDPALGTLLAEKMGMTAVFYSMSEELLINSLNCGLTDIAISAIEPTDSLRRSAEFSDSYITMSSAIVANGGNSAVNGTADLRSALCVGTVSGSLSARYLSEGPGLSNTREYSGLGELEGAMLRGDIDIMFCDSFFAREFIAEYPLFVIKEDNIDRHRFAAAAADGNSRLIREVNDVLDEFRSGGTLLDLRRAYIENDAALREQYNLKLKNIQQIP